VNRRLVVSPEAEADLDAVCSWYDAEKLGLSRELRVDFAEALRSISAHPLLPAMQYRKARRVLLKRFRYHLYYAVTADYINIIAFVHAHRHPKEWRRSIRSRLK